MNGYLMKSLMDTNAYGIWMMKNLVEGKICKKGRGSEEGCG